MAPRLKPIHQQVIFITGATSGIGLATLKMALERGARVFMVARNEDELQKLQDEMRLKNFQTAYAVADVAEYDQMEFAADQCIATFGTIDTWINNAGVSMFARLLDTEDYEAKRVFDTNFWGVVNGCKIAARMMKDNGGAIINIGSLLSEVSLPIQGIYSASKHAVKGYTDSLRRELMADKAPISVTLIMPGAIDTPYTLHAESHIGEPTHTPPVYHADVVAKMILKCAETPIRELSIGSSAFIMPWLDKFFPGIEDKIMSRRYMEKNQSLKNEEFSTTAHPIEGEVSGNYPGHVMKSSAMTELATSGKLKQGLVTLTTALLGVGAIFLRRRRLN